MKEEQQKKQETKESTIKPKKSALGATNRFISLFDYWKQEDKYQLIIKLQYGFMGLLLVLFLLCFWGWKSAPERLTLYLPPDISGGVFIKADQIPPQDVYEFAFQVFGSINNWTNNGTSDYSTLIQDYKDYFSPSFKSWLNSDYQAKAAQNALDRKRYMTLYGTYNSDDVTKVSQDSWQVNLEVEIVETVDNQVVKDVIMQYPLLITRADLPITSNPWGLVISGFASQPTRIKTNV